MGGQGSSVLQSALIEKVDLFDMTEMKTIKYRSGKRKAHGEPKRQATRC
jgi:hypothetical protein